MYISNKTRFEVISYSNITMKAISLFILAILALHATAQATSKNVRFKSGQNRQKIIISLCKSKSVKHSVALLYFQAAKVSSNVPCDAIWRIRVEEVETVRLINITETNANIAGSRNVSKWGWEKRVRKLFICFIFCFCRNWI